MNYLLQEVLSPFTGNDCIIVPGRSAVIEYPNLTSCVAILERALVNSENAIEGSKNVPGAIGDFGAIVVYLIC